MTFTVISLSFAAYKKHYPPFLSDEVWEEVKSFDDEASLIGALAQFSVISSSSPCFILSRCFYSHKNVGFDYAPDPGSSPYIISSQYCVGETSGSNSYALQAIKIVNIALLSDQTLNFPGQITNSHSPQTFCSEDLLQYFDTDYQSENVSLESPIDL